MLSKTDIDNIFQARNLIIAELISVSDEEKVCLHTLPSSTLIFTSKNGLKTKGYC